MTRGQRKRAINESAMYKAGYKIIKPTNGIYQLVMGTTVVGTRDNYASLVRLSTTLLGG
jgi:hypothetical protein